MTLFLTDMKLIPNIKTILSSLKTGRSQVLLKCYVGKQLVEIKIKENIKLTSLILSDINKISGINNISFS